MHFNNIQNLIKEILSSTLSPVSIVCDYNRQKFLQFLEEEEEKKEQKEFVDSKFTYNVSVRARVGLP